MCRGEEARGEETAVKKKARRENRKECSDEERDHRRKKEAEERDHVSCKKRADQLEGLWNGKCYWSFSIGKSAGVKQSLFRLILPEKKTTASDTNLFFEQIHDFFLTQGDYIIASDFNCVDRMTDKLHCSAVLSSDSNVLSRLKSDFSLVDLFRMCNPRKISFT